MLYYKFERIFNARRIFKPFSYLQKAGFSGNFASRIKNERVSRLELKQLERLCLLLRCTPNDLMEWIPEENTDFEKNHPLNDLRKRTDQIDLLNIINSIPLGKLDKIEQMINEELNK